MSSSCAGTVTTSILQWPARRSLVFLGMASYLFWIAIVHHTASTWMRRDLVAVTESEFIAPFGIIGRKASSPVWRSFRGAPDASNDLAAAIEAIDAASDEGHDYHESSLTKKLSPVSMDEANLTDHKNYTNTGFGVELTIPVTNKFFNESYNGTEISLAMAEPSDLALSPPASLRNNATNVSNAANLTANETVSETKEQFALSLSESPSCEPLNTSEIAFTLVTQCDDERVELVAQHCLRWNGPLSVAVYSTRSAEEIMTDIVALGCIRDQLHVSTLSPTAESLSGDSYPVNHLRNLALKQVLTSHIVYMDVDFMASSDLESTLASESIKQALADDHKHALVIPAFEYKPACHNCSSQAELLGRMPRSRDELMLLHDRGEASMFHEYWPVAHDSTDYAMWKHQEHGTLLNISCIRSNHYEPYLIIRKCQEMPPFQEAFTGYGYNKASFTMQLQAMQYRLSQVGGVFCTHFPHATSKARQLFDLDKETKTGPRLEIAELVKNYTSWLDETYGHVAPRVPNCKAIAVSGPSQAVKQVPVVAAHVHNVSRRTASTQFFADSQALSVCTDVKPEEVSYSLVTQCSDDRLWMMGHHCQRWSVNNSIPQITLAVYTNDTMAEVKAKLLNLSCPVDRGLTVLTFPRIYNDKSYPVNYFRNEALAAVNTTHAVFLDVDFWPSNDLFATLNGLSVRSKLSESVENAIVVPALQLNSQCKGQELDCPEKHVPMMPFVKDEFMFENSNTSNITAFNFVDNPDGHGSTRYDWWTDQAAGQLLEIRCVQSNRYEPYLVVRVCRDLPPFQPVFTGYGKNKISWILHLRRLGWRFYQIGQAFAIHYPHKNSKARRAWRGGTIRGVKASDNATTIFEDSMRSQNDKHFVEFRHWLAESVPNRTKIFKCTEEGFSQDDDAALWVTRAD